MGLLIRRQRLMKFNQPCMEHPWPVSTLVDRSTHQLSQATHKRLSKYRSKHMCLRRQHQMVTGMRRLGRLQWLPIFLETLWHQ